MGINTGWNEICHAAGDVFPQPNPLGEGLRPQMGVLEAAHLKYLDTLPEPKGFYETKKYTQEEIDKIKESDKANITCMTHDDRYGSIDPAYPSPSKLANQFGISVETLIEMLESFYKHDYDRENEKGREPDYYLDRDESKLWYYETFKFSGNSLYPNSFELRSYKDRGWYLIEKHWNKYGKFDDGSNIKRYKLKEGTLFYKLMQICKMYDRYVHCNTRGLNKTTKSIGGMAWMYFLQDEAGLDKWRAGFEKIRYIRLSATDKEVERYVDVVYKPRIEEITNKIASLTDEFEISVNKRLLNYYKEVVSRLPCYHSASLV